MMYGYLTSNSLHVRVEVVAELPRLLFHKVIACNYLLFMGY